MLSKLDMFKEHNEIFTEQIIPMEFIEKDPNTGNMVRKKLSFDLS